MGRRLIDPAIDKLSNTIYDMGQDAITCFSLELIHTWKIEKQRTSSRFIREFEKLLQC